MIATAMNDFTTHAHTFFDHIEDVREPLVVERPGENMVVIPQMDYNGIMETLHQLSTAANIAHLGKSMEQVERGECVSMDIDNLWT